MSLFSKLPELSKEFIDPNEMIFIGEQLGGTTLGGLYSKKLGEYRDKLRKYDKNSKEYFKALKEYADLIHESDEFQKGKQSEIDKKLTEYYEMYLKDEFQTNKREKERFLRKAREKFEMVVIRKFQSNPEGFGSDEMQEILGFTLLPDKVEIEYTDKGKSISKEVPIQCAIYEIYGIDDPLLSIAKEVMLHEKLSSFRNITTNSKLKVLYLRENKLNLMVRLIRDLYGNKIIKRKFRDTFKEFQNDPKSYLDNCSKGLVEIKKNLKYSMNIAENTIENTIDTINQKIKKNLQFIKKGVYESYIIYFEFLLKYIPDETFDKIYDTLEFDKYKDDKYLKCFTDPNYFDEIGNVNQQIRQEKSMNEKRGQLLKNQNLKKIKEKVYNRVKEKVIELSNIFTHRNINSNKNTQNQHDRINNDDIESYVLRRIKQIKKNQKKSNNSPPFRSLSDLGKYLYPTFGNYPSSNHRSPNYQSIRDKEGTTPPFIPKKQSILNSSYIPSGTTPPLIQTNKTNNISYYHPKQQTTRRNPQQNDKFRKMFYNDLYGGSTGLNGQLKKMWEINYNFNK